MRSTGEIEEWICEYIAGILKMKPEDILIDISFDRLGLDSSTAVALVGDLEDWLGVEVDPTLPYDYPTIRSFAARLSETSMTTA